MTPPTLTQLEAYIKLRKLSTNPEKFLMHYEDIEPAWTNKDGKPVKNWKLTCQSWHFNNMSRADTHRCSMCSSYGVYVYKDDTGLPYWRCVDHKKKAKTVPDIVKTIKIHKVENPKVNYNNERNRQTKALKKG